MMIGKQEVCINQMAKVNNWTSNQISEHITESFKTHYERSKHQWTLDISILSKPPYNIKLKPLKKRIFEVKKHKKKKKKTAAKKTAVNKKFNKRPKKH